MYDDFDDCWVIAEDNYHADLRMIAEEEERQYLGWDEEYEPTAHEDDGDYDDLLDEYDFPFSDLD